MVEKRMKRNVWKYFTESFKTLWKQPIIVIPLLINVIVSFISLMIADFASSGNPLIQEYAATGAIASFSLESFYPLIAIYAVALIISFLISSFFYAGAIGMIYDVVRKKKTSLKAMVDYGKKFFLRLIGINIVLGLLSMAGITIALLPLLIDQTWLTFILTLILGIAFVLFMILFLLSNIYLIIQNKGVLASISKSFSVIKKNYFRFILLIILLTACGALVNFIPYIGMLISQLIIGSASGIAFVLFALDNK